MNDETHAEVFRRDLLNGGAILSGAAQHAGHVDLVRGFIGCSCRSGG